MKKCERCVWIHMHRTALFPAHVLSAHAESGLVIAGVKDCWQKKCCWVLLSSRDQCYWKEHSGAISLFCQQQGPFSHAHTPKKIPQPQPRDLYTPPKLKFWVNPWPAGLQFILYITLFVIRIADCSVFHGFSNSRQKEKFKLPFEPKSRALCCCLSLSWQIEGMVSLPWNLLVCSTTPINLLGRRHHSNQSKKLS